MDIFHLRKEIDACDKTALEAVMSVDEERIFLEKKAEELSALGNVMMVTLSLNGDNYYLLGILLVK